MRQDDTTNNLVFSPSKDYTSFRVGPFAHPANSQYSTVPYQDIDGLIDVGVGITVDKAALNEIFLAYDRMNGVLDSSGNIVTEGTASNLNWLNGRCLAAPDTMHFSVGTSNPKSGGPGAGYQDFLWVGPQISLMNGLLVLTIDDSTSTNSFTDANWADEEYHLRSILDSRVGRESHNMAAPGSSCRHLGSTTSSIPLCEKADFPQRSSTRCISHRSTIGLQVQTGRQRWGLQI